MIALSSHYDRGGRSLRESWSAYVKRQYVERKNGAPYFRQRLTYRSSYCEKIILLQVRSRSSQGKWPSDFTARGTLNRRRAASPHVRREALDHLQGVLPQNWCGSELNCTVTFMVLKTTANDRCTSSPLPR
ncbi:hypothetical protein TNCV_1224831 [Trichonephila clavipes]|nr:hypothetical protein TNCV_1224831 [Trichonephila clavipes]